MTLSHLQHMQQLSFGMDILILSVTSPHEELFWKKRLDRMRGQIIKEHTKVITVCEDWKGGAGNALGTLYAFSKANQTARNQHQLDLFDALDDNRSIALYHTAGKGTRLAPLTSCEYNSKSRIKLVGKLHECGTSTPITLLEATIKQTSIFAPKRKGRLSVFWGDQLFIPEYDIRETKSEVNLLTKLLSKRPSDQDWLQKGYHKYGLVLVDKSCSFKQLEKLSFEKFSQLPQLRDEKVGLSLGSFSLSKRMLKALLKEFQPELREKKIKLDTDPHLWMPLSLSKDDYLRIFTDSSASSHYERIQKFKTQFDPAPLLDSTDLGENTLWWDYGNIASFLENSLKLNASSEEGKAMRTFFSTPNFPENSVEKTLLKVENSTLINCKIKKGTIKNSVLINVVADEVQLQDSVLIETSAQKIDANSAILYNVAQIGLLHVADHKVRSDIFSNQDGHIKFHNSILSPIPWEQCAKENPFSFAKLHQLIQGLHPSEGQQCAQTAHQKVKQAVTNLKIHNQE